MNRFACLFAILAASVIGFVPARAANSTTAHAANPAPARAANVAPARIATPDEAAIRKLLDNWAKAFHDKDVNAIMAMYKPGRELVAYDIVPPLRYVGYSAYKRDYNEFLAEYKGPIDVTFRHMVIVAGDTVAYAHGLERISGVLQGGQKSDMWVRFTSCFRKINGKWLDTHDHVSVPVDLNHGKAMVDLTP